MLDAGSDALNQKSHRLVRNLDETLDAKDVVRRGGFGDFLNQNFRRLDTPEIDDERFEIVVVVLFFGVVMGGSVSKIAFGGDARAPEGSSAIPGRFPPRRS